MCGLCLGSPEMPWNYEKGCDEAVAYTALNSHGGPLTPRAGPIIDPDRTREDQATMVAKVHDWQQKETWLKLNRDDWFDLAAKYPKDEQWVKCNHVSVPHFVVNGTPVIPSDVSLPGVITIVNSEKPYDGRYNFQ